MAPTRLHALIDGVFAIAITLLVLDLPRPAGAADLRHDLLHAWPSYAAYVVSFATIGVVWIEHHGMMSAVERANRRFIERTLVFLLFVSVIPWPTALAAEYVRDGGAPARTAALIYVGALLLMGLSFALSWRYLERHEELVAPQARPGFPAGRRRALLGAAAYAPVLVVALISPIAAVALTGAIAVYFAASRTDVPTLLTAPAPPR